MPTYQYACKKCGRKFSLTMGLDEHETKKVRCPKCRSENPKSVIAPFFVTTSRKS